MSQSAARAGAAPTRAATTANNSRARRDKTSLIPPPLPWYSQEGAELHGAGDVSVPSGRTQPCHDSIAYAAMASHCTKDSEEMDVAVLQRTTGRICQGHGERIGTLSGGRRLADAFLYRGTPTAPCYRDIQSGVFSAASRLVAP